MKKIIILCLGILANCSLEKNNSTHPNSIEQIKINFPTTTLNLDSSIQTKYKSEWLKNVVDIKRGTYYGKVDIWGGGDLDLYLWFQDGNLWDSMIKVDNQDYVLYTLLDSNKYKASFVNSYTAIMEMPASASPKLAGSLFVIMVSNNTIYRSEKSSGFANQKDWNKQNIPQHQLIEIAKRQGQFLSAEMITGGHNILYKEGTYDQITLIYDKDMSGISSLENNILKFSIDRATIYLDQNVLYKDANSTVSYSLQRSSSLYQYTMKIQEHKIIEITVSINEHLGEHIFKVPADYYTYKYVVIKNNKEEVTTALSEKNVSLDSQEGNIQWYKTSWFDYRIPIDTSVVKKIPVTKYATGNTNVTLEFFTSGRLKSITLEINDSK